MSQAQYFSQFLANIKLNDLPVDWTSEDTSYLVQAQWDAEFEDAVGGAQTVEDIGDFVARQCDGSTASSLQAPAGPAGKGARGAAPSGDLKIFYAGTEGYMQVAKVSARMLWG